MTKPITNTTEKTPEQEAALKAATAACTMFMAEIDSANDKWPAKFNSSNEALGSLRKQYMDVEKTLADLKILQGKPVNLYSKTKAEDLKHELVQLGAMCAKALYSLTDMEQETAEMNKMVEEHRAARRQRFVFRVDL